MNFHKFRICLIMSFYAIAYQLLAAETLQIPPAADDRVRNLS
jgi:hypothetical protein